MDQIRNDKVRISGLRDQELSVVFKQGVTFEVHKLVVDGDNDMNFFVVPDNVFPFVSNNYPAETDGFSWKIECACVHAHAIFYITLTDNDYTNNTNSFYIIICPHEINNDILQFYDDILNKGYDKPITFGLVGIDKAKRMFRDDFTEEGLDNNLRRHLVVFENVDVSNVRMDPIGTSLLDGRIHRGPKYFKFCDMCKAHAPKDIAN